MTPLGREIAARIAASGPITVADFMAECLLHPRHGYYTTRDPFGTAGDFITAPEISQMFGELIGLALAQTWLDQGRPARIALAEIGPGRGTLMADALRATRGVPGFHDAAEVHLVEASPTLRARQAEAMPQAQFHDSLASLPDLPLYLVANEFLDALPIRQHLRSGAGWRERMVGLEDGKLAFGLGPETPLGALEHRLGDTREGDLVEHAPALPAIVGEIGRRIDARGGAALLIDYGDWGSQGDTLQALKGHAPVDPLATPGEADLTAHVDFAEVARAAAPARYSRVTPQGVFLERLGITDRAKTLAAGLSGARLSSHIAAHRRLTHPEEMGRLFKVIGLYPATGTPPPGLET